MRKCLRGRFLYGVETGKGKYTWKWDVYEGDFNWIRTGKGKYTWNDGNVYEGDFVNGVMTGKGKSYLEMMGDVYEGDFVKLGLMGKTGKENILGEMEIFLWVILIKVLKVKEECILNHQEKENSENIIKEVNGKI